MGATSRITRSQAKQQQTELFSPTFAPPSVRKPSQQPSPSRQQHVETPSSSDDESSVVNDENRTPDPTPNAAPRLPPVAATIAAPVAVPSSPDPPEQQEHHHHGHHSHMEVDDTVEDPDAEDDEFEEFDPWVSLPIYLLSDIDVVSRENQSTSTIGSVTDSGLSKTFPRTPHNNGRRRFRARLDPRRRLRLSSTWTKHLFTVRLRILTMPTLRSRSILMGKRTRYQVVCARIGCRSLNVRASFSKSSSLLQASESTLIGS